MGNEVISYLSKHIKLSPRQKELIEKCTIVKSYTKGTILLRQGNIANESYFVLKGIVRSYAINDNEQETTIEFYPEEQAIIPLTYGKRIPSTHFLECLEDCTLIINNPEYEQEMFAKYPEFESICRVMGEVMMAQLQESFTDYKTRKPEERYLYIMEHRPTLLQRVPLYQLASYLGIKPESLSRLRKRLTKNN
ncbi:MAG: Crp/Fnr family transcriptional regulator [Chitinophagales bacterium]|nr:Crp/Fnr family transcriptional regulator [Chitinophagales bacterium]